MGMFNLDGEVILPSLSEAYLTCSHVDLISLSNLGPVSNYSEGAVGDRPTVTHRVPCVFPGTVRLANIAQTECVTD